MSVSVTQMLIRRNSCGSGDAGGIEFSWGRPGAFWVICWPASSGARISHSPIYWAGGMTGINALITHDHMEAAQFLTKTAARWVLWNLFAAPDLWSIEQHVWDNDTGYPHR